MKKRFVLDTNVLLHDPRSIFSFQEHDVYIPIPCIEEVDDFKQEQSDRGRNAREVARHLDDLRGQGSLHEGVSLGKGRGSLRVLTKQKKLPHGHSVRDDMDSLILGCAYAVPGVRKHTILVTMDTNLRIRADALGIETANFTAAHVSDNPLEPCHQEILVPQSTVDRLYREGEIQLEDAKGYINQFAKLVNAANPSHAALGRFTGPNTIRLLSTLKNKDTNAWGIRAKNMEQQFALDLLLDDEIKLVALVGLAGSGKTLLALAAGLQKVTEENLYNKVLVSRPIIPMGKDLGYLPGTMAEKMNPWIQPIFDNVEFLMGIDKKDKRGNRSPQELIDMGMLQVEALTYIRGRSIPQQFMIIDEAQNLSIHEVKTIITRAGEGTKIVLTGDPSQIDSPYLDETSNGLVHIVNKFKGQKLFGHATLVRGERSALAALAAELL